MKWGVIRRLYVSFWRYIFHYAGHMDGWAPFALLTRKRSRIPKTNDAAAPDNSRGAVRLRIRLQHRFSFLPRQSDKCPFTPTGIKSTPVLPRHNDTSGRVKKSEGDISGVSNNPNAHGQNIPLLYFANLIRTMNAVVMVLTSEIVYYGLSAVIPSLLSQQNPLKPQ